MKRTFFFLLAIAMSFSVRAQDGENVSPVGSLNIVSGGLSIWDNPVNLKTVSDVDVDIPQAVVDSNYRVHVMIIANQDYVDECPVETALNDGRVMREYCIHMLGIPEEQVIFKANCTGLQMERAVKDFARDMEYNSRKEDLFLFFYFGHGTSSPNMNEDDKYLLPVDGTLANIGQEGMSLKRIIKEHFEKKKPSRLVIYLENSSCRSNIEVYQDRIIALNQFACHDNQLRSAKTVRSNTAAPSFVLEPVPDDNFKGNIVVVCASSHNETAYALSSQNHNVFTYAFLKALKQSGGDITLGELFDNAIEAASNMAWRELRCEQRPTITASTTLGDAWRLWKLSM